MTMPTLGEKLRGEREKRGVDLEDVAQVTRIRERFLSALERDALAELPGGAFNKGFVRAYARYLGLDPRLLVRKYIALEDEQILAGKLPPRGDILEKLRQSAKWGRATRARLGRRALAIGLAVGAPLLVGVGGLALAAWYGVLPLPRALTDQDSSTRWRSTVTQAATAREAQPDTLEDAAVSSEGAASTARADQEATRAADAAETASSPDSAREPVVEDSSSGVPEQAPALTSPAHQRQRPAPVPARAIEPADATADAPSESHLSVIDSGVGTGVVDRQLSGRAERFEEGSIIVFWTRVVGGRSGDSIHHVWIHEGERIGLAVLPLGGAHWRTHSRRALVPGSSGRWTVEARDVEGRLLATHTFSCEP
ncbi:MAG: DUF2914 domain-containing protein [Acidobacteriota bacterium]|nr:MAG: DUF2914 domain-containing protein [Acidobacteriota bacterium]